MKPWHKSRIFWASFIAGTVNSAMVTALQTDVWDTQTRTILASVAAAMSYIAMGLRVDDASKGGK